MTDEELALIRRSIADGLGITHGRAARLLAALDEARATAIDLGVKLAREVVAHQHERANDPIQAVGTGRLVVPDDSSEL